jgi:hypothetical protein
MFGIFELQFVHVKTQYFLANGTCEYFLAKYVENILKKGSCKILNF